MAAPDSLLGLMPFAVRLGIVARTDPPDSSSRLVAQLTQAQAILAARGEQAG